MAYSYDHANKKWRANRITRHGAIFVENHKIGWLEGRQFKTYLDLNIPTSGVWVVKIVFPVEAVIHILDLDIIDGELLWESVHGGTEGGSFNVALPVIPTNFGVLETPQPAYQAQATLNRGGTHTGGTVTDISRLKVSNATAQASSVGRTNVDVVFMNATTCYMRFTAVAAVKGTFKMVWEERLATPPV